MVWECKNPKKNNLIEQKQWVQYHHRHPHQSFPHQNVPIHVVGPTLVSCLLGQSAGGPPIKPVVWDAVNRVVTVPWYPCRRDVSLVLRLPTVNPELQIQKIAGTDVVTKTEVREIGSGPAVESDKVETHTYRKTSTVALRRIMPMCKHGQ